MLIGALGLIVAVGVAAAQVSITQPVNQGGIRISAEPKDPPPTPECQSAAERQLEIFLAQMACLELSTLSQRISCFIDVAILAYNTQPECP